MKLPDARTRRRFRRDPSAMVGLGIVSALAAFALVGPLLVGADPNASDFSLTRDPRGGLPGPSLAHPLGTDPLFRDLLARLAHGARLSLLVATGATALALGIGTAGGLAAAHARSTRLGRLDDALMRIVDVALAFPYLLLITAIGVVLDRSDALTVTLILGLTGWTGIARVTRAKALSIRQLAYVEAARALGASGWRIAVRHVLPGLSGTLLVIGSHAVAQMILAEAVLGYLTVGIDPPRATWGRMLHEAEHYLGVQPLVVAAPGVAIVLSVLGFSRLGDGLRDALDPSGPAQPRSRRARVLLDAAVLSAAVLLVGFAEPDPLAPPEPRGHEPAAPRRGGVLRVATHVGVQSLDPAIAYDEASRSIGDLIFARLMAYDHERRLVGDLAERMEPADGGRRYRFVLREGLRFHDGATLEAADVKRSLERTLHPETPSPGAHLFHRLEGYAAFREGHAPGISGIAALDRLTLELRLSEPDATFPALLTMGFAAPVCPGSGIRVDPRQPVAPCGAGPFVLVEHQPGERVRLRRFAGYHQPGKPYLDGVEWLLGVPARSQRYRFESGELDLIADLNGIDMARYAADARWEPYRGWVIAPETHGLFLNTELPPFDDVHMRRAVAFALDGSVLGRVHAGIAETTRVIPSSLPGPPHDRPMRRHDLARALEEMAAAGYPYDPASDRGGYPEPIELVTVPDSFEQSSAEIFQQQLARVGIRVRLELVSWASWLALTTTRGKVRMGWRGWGADYPDPSNFFEAILVSEAIRDRDGQNVSFFSHAELDDVVARAHREIDPVARMALYERAERIVADEAPWIPLYTHRSLVVWQPYVHGYRPHPVEPMRLRDVWLSAERHP